MSRESGAGAGALASRRSREDGDDAPGPKRWGRASPGKTRGSGCLPPGMGFQTAGKLSPVKFPRGPRAQGKGRDPGGNLGSDWFSASTSS